jgi:hypothetical protein
LTFLSAAAVRTQTSREEKKIPFQSSNTAVYESLTSGVENSSATAPAGTDSGTGTSYFLIASFGRVRFARAIFFDSIEKNYPK